VAAVEAALAGEKPDLRAAVGRDFLDVGTAACGDVGEDIAAAIGGDVADRSTIVRGSCGTSDSGFAVGLGEDDCRDLGDGGCGHANAEDQQDSRAEDGRGS